MIKINLIAIGKIKEKYFAEGIAEYAKRLSAFCEFKISELEEENYKKTDAAAEEKIRKKEGEMILKNLSDFSGKVFALAIEGKKFSSKGFSEIVGKAAAAGDSLAFIIGGSYGLSEDVKKRADGLVSFSDMTFPHAMFRLIFTEQLYRAFTILNGKNYHK